MAGPPNAILAINSLDRFSRQGQTVDQSLDRLYFNEPPPSNNFTLQSGGAFIYGYIDKIVVSAIQLQYNCPTIVPSVPFGDGQQNNSSTAGNDYLIIAYTYIDPSTSEFVRSFVDVTIPYGFYNPDEIAAVLTLAISTTDINTLAPNFEVTYSNVNGATGGGNGGFNFDAGDNDVTFRFWFPFVGQVILDSLGVPLPPEQQPYYSRAYARCLRLLGMTFQNSAANQVGSVDQGSTSIINFLYTPYVDIISETLTKFQNIKDTDTSPNKLNSIIARIYLSGGGSAQALTGDGYPLGSAPFTIVQDLNSPKIIRWSPAEAVYNIDFQVRDSYGDLLFNEALYSDQIPFITVSYNYSTEFQMTLLCSEKKTR